MMAVPWASRPQDTCYFSTNRGANESPTLKTSAALGGHEMLKSLQNDNHTDCITSRGGLHVGPDPPPLLDLLTYANGKQ